MKYKEGDLVLCTVDKVENTVCFVHLPDETKGTIISSEIAPGRIKFMRAYVVPNKKIVCKVLRVTGDHIDLSLRRVNAKEKKQVLQEYKQELANKSALKQILKEDYPTIKEKILKEYSEILEFIKNARENPKILNKYIPQEHIEKTKKIIEKKKKQVELKYLLSTKCFESDGINRIKNLFNINNNEIKIIYLSAGKFSLKLKSNDFKEGKIKIQKILEELEKKAKELNIELEYKEEKH